MARDVEAMQEKPPNACCAALKEKNTKLLEKCKNLTEIKNQFRECTALVQEKYNVIEKENESLKKALEEINLQANMWKDEKEREAGRRIDLEDEVSALHDEVRSLKQNGNSTSEEADKQLQERLVVAEKEIKELNLLLGQERGRVALEKKNAELEKKKADEALKKVEMGKNKVSEAQKVANAERKKAEENRILLEKFKKETDDLKTVLALEKSKSEAAEKKVDAEKQKTIRERTRADSAMAKYEEQREIAEANLKKATFEKDRADDLNRKLEEAKNKAEAAEKKVEAEKQRAIRERKRADMAVAKSEEQRKLAETNMKKAMFEKDRADDLNTKLGEARNRAGKTEKEMLKHKCAGKLVEAQDLQSNAGRNAELTSNACVGMLKNDSQISQWMEKMLLEKGHNVLREKTCADSEKKKAKKQKKVAEEHKRVAMEQKSRADQLSKELESYKLKFEESQKELQEFISCRIVSNVPSRNNDVVSETDRVKLLKKQLELERMLVKHTKKATKLEAVRNKMLHQELCHLKQECCQFQQRLDILDKSFLLGREGIGQLEKIGNQVSKRKMLCSDGSQSQLTSGTDSRMDPPYGDSNRKMLQSSAINSSSASFSDRPLVGSQEKGTLSVMTPANLGEDISNCEPSIGRLSEKMRTRHNEHGLAKADKSMRSPIKEGANKRRFGCREKMGILDAGESIDNMYSKGSKLHQWVSEKPSAVHGILNSQKDDPKDKNLKETSCRELSRPCKKRKTSSEGTAVIHCLQTVESESMLDSNTNGPNDCMPASSRGPDLMKLPGHFKDGMNNITRHYHCTQDFDEMVAHDYMKLLDLDNAADEDSYRRAIAMPLSPMLPMVEFIEADNSEILVCRSFQEGLPNVHDTPTSVSRFHVIETEKNHTNLSSKGPVPSLLQTKEGPMEFTKKLDPLSIGDTHLRQIHASGGKLGMSDLSGSGSEEISLLRENVIESPDGGLLKYFVVASDNKDSSSILRILKTISSCMPHRSFIHSAEPFLRTILHTLLKEEALSIKEKACVFFSLILREISTVELDNPTNVLTDNSVQILGSMTMHINSVFSDPLFRRTFTESCDLFELLAVVEDFLLQRKLLVCGEVSADSGILSTSKKLNIVLNDNEVMLSEVVASARLLIVGASLLASLCSAIDHIGFVCEVSCNIIRTQKCNPSVMLAILHAFAHICGSRYLALQQYSLPMTVIKSLVIYLEKQILASNSTSLAPSEVGSQSKIWLCTNCLFLEGAVPMEDAAVLLLENLQKQCHSESCSLDSLALNNLIPPKVRSHEDGTVEGSGLREAVPLSSKSDENICNFIDVLSLVEVLASFMSWDWTSNHLVRQICEYLESRLMEGSSAAIVALLGQLGSIGVDAGGYDDSGVTKLRGWLSAFVCESSFTKFSLSIQFAIITSLLSLTPMKLEDIIEGGTSHSIPANFIREWFSSLTDEQQPFLRIHQTTGENSS